MLNSCSEPRWRARQIAPCSAHSGAGMDELRSLLDTVLDDLPPVRDSGRPRLPIDRAFSISGFGTVVTGTLLDGSLRLGDSVVVEPGGATGRVRGLQSHEQSLDEAPPGARTAVNLSGISAHEIERGMVLSSPGWLSPTRAVDVRLRVVRRASKPLPHNATRTLHIGAAEAQARVRLLEGDELLPGQSAWAQLRLEEPVAAARGDHFVLRSGEATIAGGRVVDTRPRRHHRNDESTLEALRRLLDGSPDDTLLTLIQRLEPVRWSELLTRSELAEQDALTAIQRQIASGAVVALDDAGLATATELMSESGLAATTGRARTIVSDYVAEFPLRAGLPREDLRSRLRLSQRAFAFIEQRLIQSGELTLTGAALDLPDRTAALSEEQKQIVRSLLERLHVQGVRPEVDHSLDPNLLEYLEARGEVVRLKDGVTLAHEVYRGDGRQDRQPD